MHNHIIIIHALTIRTTLYNPSSLLPTVVKGDFFIDLFGLLLVILVIGLLGLLNGLLSLLLILDLLGFLLKFCPEG